MVITMDDENIFELVHRAFQSEKEDYGEEQRQNGIQEGRYNADIEIASGMLNMGYSLKEIADITYLDINTLKQLK